MIDGKIQIVVEADLTPGQNNVADVRWTPDEMPEDDVAMMLLFVLYNKMLGANPHKSRREIADILSEWCTTLCEAEDECDIVEAKFAARH